MTKLINSVDINKAMEINMPDDDGLLFMLVNTQQFIKDLKNALNKKESTKGPMFEDIEDLNGIVEQLTQIKTQYALITIENNPYEPWTIIHALSKQEMEKLANDKYQNANYCQKLAELCSNADGTQNVPLCYSTPYYNNPAVLKHSKELENIL